MTGKQATKKVIVCLNKKVVFKGVKSQHDLAKFLGESHMTIWDRMKNGGWTDVEKVGLSELLDLHTLFMSDADIKQNLEALFYLNRKKKSVLVYSRVRMAKKLELPLSTFYYRLNHHNWKEKEINIIKRL